MDQWHESASVYAATVLNSPEAGLTCVKHDLYNDLVWVGLSNGYVMSFRSRTLEPFVSFEVHKGPVRDIQLSDRYIWTVGADGTYRSKRKGFVVSHIPEACGDLLLLLENDLYVANSRRVNKFNISTGRETGSFALDANENASILFLSSTVYNFCLGLDSGTVQIIDCDSFDVVQTERCHTGPLTSLDCKRNLVVTCGMSNRKYGVATDQMIHIYDSRTRRQLAMPPLSAGARLAVIHPKAATCLFAISPAGQVFFIDTKCPNQMSIKQMAVISEPRFMEVNHSGDGLLIAETNGVIHYWTRNDVIEPKPLPRELTVTENQYLPTMENDDPLSVIGMPYYKSILLSAWDHNAKFEVGVPPETHLQTVENNVIRSHKPGSRGNRRSSVSVPMFLSERERLGIEASSHAELFEDERTERNKVPRAYRQLEIRYSRFGVDDFDFKFYNSSPYAGLENQSPGDTYCNAVLQLLRWCPQIYNWALQSFAANVNEPVPVLGLVAMLFDMLHKAGNRHCRATNFLNMLSDDTELNASSLLNQTSSSSNKISVLLFYMLDKLLNEEKDLPSPVSSGEGEVGVSSLFTAINISHTQRSYGTCGYRDFSSVMSPHLEAKSPSLKGLTAALRSSLEGTLWCEGCKKEHRVTIVKQADRLPDVLFITTPGSEDNVSSNCGSVTPSLTPTTSSSSTSSSTTSGASSEPLSAGFSVEKRADKSLKFVESDNPEFSLLGYIAEVIDRECRHTVTVVKIEDQWYLFNDFLVTPLTQEQALDTSAPWKQPILLLYSRISASQKFQYESWKSKIDPGLLLHQQYCHYNPNAVEKAEPLTEEELKPGLMVALDAEFVLQKREITEIHSNGSKQVVKPGTLSLARVSVVRAEGPKAEVPLIDDVIETKHAVHDYLTVYSGIEPGDLNPDTSSYSLVAHQTAIRKLWILLNKGCTFIGHALANDFRTINLQVPPEQLIDTIDLFQRSGPRKLSLKFLIWAVLGERVQVGNHDSIEDSVSALRLYKEYCRLKDSGGLSEMLDRIYELGQATNYKVPGVTGGASA